MKWIELNRMWDIQKTENDMKLNVKERKTLKQTKKKWNELASQPKQ